MKPKLPFGTALRIAMAGRVLTKILTIFLCAFSFALVGLATTGVFYNESKVLASALLNYMDITRPALVFKYTNSVEQEQILPLRWIERIQEETGLDFVQHYEVVEYTGIFYSELKGNRADNAVSGTPQAYRDCGVKLVAGKFPEEMDEVAITLDRFEGFQDFGYSYNVQRYVYVEDGILYTDLPYTFNEKTQSYYFDFGGYIQSVGADEEGYHIVDAGFGERQEIGTYEDIIGKELVLLGDAKRGSLGNESLYTVTITGVVDIDEAYFTEYGRDAYTLLHSVAWREAFWPTLKDVLSNLAQGPTDDYDLARTCADLTLEMTDEYVEIYPEARDRNLISVGVDGIAGLVDPTLPNYYNFWAGHKAYVFLGAVSGAFFGIFAVLLCWHLMTSMLAVQRIKIGILRSLGAGEKDVVKIVLLFAFILSVFTFLLSLAFTLAGYYGFLYPAFYTPKWGVSEFFFTGWTVLILAGLSFGVPLLCSIVPLRKFLKKSIVDNISGNIKAR